jgi:hypothetical protein
VALTLVIADREENHPSEAPAVEAYPVDTAQPGSTSNMFTGTVAAFARAGFKVVATREHLVDDRAVRDTRLRCVQNRVADGGHDAGHATRGVCGVS